MTNNTVIRPGTRADIDTLADFNRRMALETEDKTLSLETLRPGVAGLFDDPRRGFYLVAESSGDVAGSLMVTYEWSDWRNGNFWWVQSVYIHPEHRRKGLYRALYDEVRRLARDAGGVCGVRLYVEHENRNAQHTYEAMGMQQTGYLMYEEEF